MSASENQEQTIQDRSQPVQRFRRMVGAHHANEHVFERLGAGSKLGHGALGYQLAVMNNGYAVAKTLARLLGLMSACSR